MGCADLDLRTMIASGVALAPRLPIVVEAVHRAHRDLTRIRLGRKRRRARFPSHLGGLIWILRAGLTSVAAGMRASGPGSRIAESAVLYAFGKARADCDVEESTIVARLAVVHCLGSNAARLLLCGLSTGPGAFAPSCPSGILAVHRAREDVALLRGEILSATEAGLSSARLLNLNRPVAILCAGSAARGTGTPGKPI